MTTLQPEPCIPCSGTGLLEVNGKPVRCGYCNGTGLSRFTRKWNDILLPDGTIFRRTQ